MVTSDSLLNDQRFVSTICYEIFDLLFIFVLVIKNNLIEIIIFQARTTYGVKDILEKNVKVSKDLAQYFVYLRYEMN